MKEKLSNSARRVQEYLEAKGGKFEVCELPGSTRTAQDAADSVGCTVGQIAKSLVFKEKGTDSLVLIIASGANRVDLKKMRETAGLVLEKADGKFVKERIGFAIGGVPPVAHNEPLRTFLDEGLRAYETIWAAAGTPHAVFQLVPDQLASLTEGAWIDLREEG